MPRRRHRGGPEKARHVQSDLRFDTAIDYRGSPDLQAALRAACPDGVDAFFDNTGGEVADAVYPMLAKGARVAVVGRVAQLGGKGTRADVQEYILGARARVEGFIVYDYEHRADVARQRIAGWLAADDIRYRETVHDGIESAPQALIDVLQGRGFGKHVIRIA